MKFIENQVTSAISEIRSKVRGKVSPENAALQTMSKVDSAHNKKIQFPPEGAEEYDNDSEFSSEEDVSEVAARSMVDDSLAVDYTNSSLARPTSFSRKPAKEQEEQQSIQNSLLKRVIPKSAWNNDFIKATIPSLLIVLPIISVGDKTSEHELNFTSLKLQLIREIETAQQTLLSKQYLPEDVDNMMYMLCTFLDEKLAEQGIVFDTSLLVQFYKDSWGGEKCFSHLEKYLEKPEQNKKIIQYYDLFLSLGFLGKYGIIDQGSIILNNVRSSVKAQLYPTPMDNLSYLLDYNILPKSFSLLTPLRLFLGSLIVILLLYALISLYLHSLSRNLRSEIAAWQPPVLATIRETPPVELAAILKEGWLEIKPHPQGWLLIFTSDGAFNVGSSILTKEFKSKKNLERLGNALANYPGDLVVIGHTDNTQYKSGTGSNLQLSIDRAKTVENELRSGTSINAYNQRKITSEGKGDQEPIASNSTAEGRTKNRRVDILWKVGRKDRDEVMQILNEGDNKLIESNPY